MGIGFWFVFFFLGEAAGLVGDDEVDVTLLGVSEGQKAGFHERYWSTSCTRFKAASNDPAPLVGELFVMAAGCLVVFCAVLSSSLCSPLRLIFW